MNMLLISLEVMIFLPAMTSACTATCTENTLVSGTQKYHSTYRGALTLTPVSSTSSMLGVCDCTEPVDSTRDLITRREDPRCGRDCRTGTLDPTYAYNQPTHASAYWLHMRK